MVESSLMRREIDEAGDAAARQIAGNAEAACEWGGRLRALDPRVVATNVKVPNSGGRKSEAPWEVLRRLVEMEGMRYPTAFRHTVILMAALSYFKAVLTLPGIAGVILTIGMAVDSNVLIFERIREELRTGKTIVAAVDAGFGKAWWTIVDTHVTTVVSCAFLFIFGEGPVRGFAVTLTIGLIANVFTAVFVSKVIFDYELSGRRQLAELSI